MPLPSRLAELLGAYLQEFPARPMSLPWETPAGRAVQANLLMSSREGGQSP